jgi:L-lactate dehydrogenase (cytochrome)
MTWLDFALTAPRIGSIWFRPRILRDVSKVDYSTKLLGYKSSMPVYIVSHP